MNPLVFQRMLRLSEPNKEFKIVEVDDFITNHGGPKILLPHFTNSFSALKTSSFYFDVDILKQPFKEYAWLFSQVTGQENIELFSSMFYMSFMAPSRWIGNLIGLKLFLMKAHTSYQITSKLGDFS